MLITLQIGNLNYIYYMDVAEIKKKGRPFKMIHWITQLEEVLSNEEVLFLTDRDIVFLVNSRLSPDHRINQRTFENWVAGKFSPDDKTGEKFMEMLEEARIKQKQYLGKKMYEDDKYFYRTAWTLERKFPNEFSLKNYNINKNEDTRIIQINVGDEKQQALIENLMNPKQELSEFTIIEPKQIVSKNNENENYDF